MHTRVVIVSLASWLAVACGGGKQDKPDRGTPQGFCAEKLGRMHKQLSKAAPTADELQKCSADMGGREAKMPGYLACSGACLDQAADIVSPVMGDCFEKCYAEGQKRAMQAGAK